MAVNDAEQPSYARGERSHEMLQLTSTQRDEAARTGCAAGLVLYAWTGSQLNLDALCGSLLHAVRLLGFIY
jgi:hypothetical protein